MSGFVAIFNQDGSAVEPGLLQLLTDTLDFRGPDQRNILVSNNVGLGHALFRTTYEAEFDVQPAVMEDKFFITSSARVDARVDLQKKLNGKNKIKLDKTPDYELILHAYNRWGERCLDYLMGDFSFVIWDEVKQQLYCARDQLGIGQLHYAKIDQSVVISNSIYCLLQHPGISRQLNDQAIGDFLLLGDHTWFDKTITSFADIHTLPPAHSCTINRDHFLIKRYWDFPVDTPLTRFNKESEYIDQFQQIFSEAVSDRIRSSEIVIGMSGGLDSTATAATVKKLHSNNTGINVVTAVFDSIHPDQERYYSGLVADQLGLSIHYLDGGHYPMFDIPEPTTRPLGMWQPGFWLHMKKTESQLGSVLLSAEAADTMFEFTPLLKQNLGEQNPISIMLEIFKLYKSYNRFPNLGTGVLTKLRNCKRRDGINAYPAYPAPRWINPGFESDMHLKERWETLTNEPRYPLNVRNPQIHQYLVDVAWNMDDICMRSEFTFPEERDPFLDLRLVKFMLSLPPLPWIFNKHLLRKAMQDWLPAEIIKRPKTAIGTLHVSLLKQEQNQWIDNWEPLPALSRYIDYKKIPGLTGEYLAKDISYTHLLPLSLNNWLKGI